MISASPQERLKQLKMLQPPSSTASIPSSQHQSHPPPSQIYQQQQQFQPQQPQQSLNSDDLLSTILDQVIDFVPENSSSPFHSGSDMLSPSMAGGIGGNSTDNSYAGILVFLSNKDIRNLQTKTFFRVALHYNEMNIAFCLNR